MVDGAGRWVVEDLGVVDVVCGSERVTGVVEVAEWLRRQT